jgi:hypothetical protein
MRQINKIINKGENLLKKIGAEINKTQGIHGIPIDIYANDCLKYIDTVNNLKNISKKQKEKAKKRLFNIYLSLQDYKGSERQTRQPWPKGKEISLEDLKGEYLISADAFKGGLGFSGVSNALFLQQSGPKHDDYWRPLSKKPAALTPKKDYGIIQADYERHKEEANRMTLDEFHEEMKRQKQELLHEMRKLRETSNTNKGDVLIL